MNESGRARVAERSLWLTCVACAIPGLLALGDSSPTRVALSIALAFVPYAVSVALADALAPARAERLAMLSALCAGMVLAFAPAALSDDLYRYLWDGRVLGHGLDPYARAPSDPTLAPLRDELWTHINHRELRTIYPPVAQSLFALCDKLAHTPVTLKLAMLAGHLIAIRAVSLLAPQQASRAIVAYALNPLALSESALNGHVDVLAGAALAFAVLGLTTRRELKASLTIAIATGTKLVGLLLLPLSARLGFKRFALTGVACLLVLSPMLVPRPAASSGAMQYAQRWRGNDALFGVIEAGVAHGLTLFANDDERARGHLRLAFAAPFLSHARGTAFDPWAQADAERREVPDRADFEIPFLAGLLARGVVLSLALGLAIGLALSPLSILSAARFTVLGALLLAPQIHPWYLLWLLPLEAAAGGLGGMTWSVSVLVAYAPLDLWQRARIWNESSLAKLCEFGLVGLVFLVEARLFNRERPEQHAGLSTLPDRPGAP